MTLKIVKDDVAKVLKSIKELANQEVLVGVPSANTAREDGADINNAELGYLMTFGGTIKMPARQQTIYRKVNSDGSFSNDGRFVKRGKSNFATTHDVAEHEITLPPRPFLGPGIVKAQKSIADTLKKAAQAALSHDDAQVSRQLTRAGIIAEQSVKTVINTSDGIEPLAPSTLASRRSRGRTGTRPLVDTGELRNSITHVVRKK